MTTHTEHTPDRAIEPSSAEAIDPREHPAAVYIAGLSRGSRPTMAAALNTTAVVLTGDDEATAADIPWHELRFQDVAALRAELQEDLAYSTVNKTLSAVRGTLKAAWKLGQMSSEDYYRAISVENVEGERLPAGRYVTVGEIGAMLDTCRDEETGEYTELDIRDAAILSLWYTTGLRRAELAALTLDDWTDENGSGKLTVMGKRNKVRSMPVENGAYDALGDWLAIRGDEAGPLFYSLGNRSRGGRMTAQALYYVLERRAAAGGVSEVTPHDMRRSFISNLLDAGADLSIAQQLAGHASPATTARYDRRPERARQRAVQALHVPYRKRTLAVQDDSGD